MNGIGKVVSAVRLLCSPRLRSFANFLTAKASPRLELEFLSGPYVREFNLELESEFNLE